MTTDELVELVQEESLRYAQMCFDTFPGTFPQELQADPVKCLGLMIGKAFLTGANFSALFLAQTDGAVGCTPSNLSAAVEKLAEELGFTSHISYTDPVKLIIPDPPPNPSAS